MTSTVEQTLALTRQDLDHHDYVKYKYRAKPGLTEELIRKISADKKEPKWMLNIRLKAFQHYLDKPLPNWGPSLKGLDLNSITYYASADAKKGAEKWEDVPDEIKNTFDKLGIPEAEQKMLSGVGAQYESEVVYHKLKKKWEDLGVIFKDLDVALQDHPELINEYFMTRCIPINDHKFISLHAAVWSGGTFIYVPRGVKIKTPLQAYFRMNAKKMGQFEHTLIIVDEGAEVHYIEGCSAPQYGEGNSSLHAGAVEIYIKKGARCRYSSVENWSKNTYNLNTKRAIVEEDGIIEWVSGNMGSGVTMLYPSSILKGRRARADHISIAYAGAGQNQDTGAKVFHLAPDTSSTIKSKGISKDGGTTTYRGLVRIIKGAKNSKCSTICDALLIDAKSKTSTIPNIEIMENEIDMVHEATVGKISQDQIFYLMSRGLDEEQALQMIVSGFIEPIMKELPLEYAIELNRLIQLEMENSVG